MKKAFTLVELLVVVAMIAMLLGVVGSSVSSAQGRARVMKATAEVKEMTNAILAYENYARGGKYKLTEMDQDASVDSVGFILGKGGAGDSGSGDMPVLYNGSVGSDGVIRDPWGRPYKVRIKEGTVPSVSQKMKSMKTGYVLPNYYRLSIGERNR